MTKSISPEILTRAIQGDGDAFRHVVEAHQGFAFAVAFRMVGSQADAEDITQESFIRLWKNLHTYKPNIKLSTWLYTIVTNLCLDFLKSARHRNHSIQRDLQHAKDVASFHQPDYDFHTKELRIEIERATEDLSPTQKAVFVLRDLQELSVDEVSDIMSLSPENIKSNLYHARKRIALKLNAVYQSQNLKL